MGETKLVPGLFGELAFVLEPDKPKAFIQTLIFGGHAAVYTRPLTIMADRKAYRYQLSLFVGLAIGEGGNDGGFGRETGQMPV